MNNIQLYYGNKTLPLSLPDEWHADVYLPKDIPALKSPIEEVTHSLDHPLNFDLSGFIHSFTKPPTVAIAVNDKTRPVPHDVLLPPLLRWLEENGILPSSIKLLIASGTHTPMQLHEYPLVIPPDILNRYEILVHDSDNTGDLITLGITSRGTPVEINRHFASADLHIAVGDIEPHHFMGYSGGVKSAAIGLAGRATIRRNHAFITHPDARTGCYFENPMRQDLEEIGRMIPVHLALNAILNRHKQTASILAGDPLAVMQAGIPLVREMSQVPVPYQYDLVIASAGAHPKDINFYQAQKGLTHAAMITKDGGSILLAAACPEGAGNRLYEQWMRGKSSHQQVLEDFLGIPFEIGIHKAYLVSRIAVKKRVFLHSEMPDDLYRVLILYNADDLQVSTDRLAAELKPGGRIAVLPQAVLTIPDLAV